MVLKMLSVMILAALIGLTAYFDKKGEVLFCSISFLVLMVYTMMAAYILTSW